MTGTLAPWRIGGLSQTLASTGKIRSPPAHSADDSLWYVGTPLHPVGELVHGGGRAGGRPDAAEPTRRRYSGVHCVYCVQGLISDITLTALTNHYARVGLPWMLQPLWDPPVCPAGRPWHGPSAVLALAGSRFAREAAAGRRSGGVGGWSERHLLAESACVALLDTLGPPPPS